MVNHSSLQDRSKGQIIWQIIINIPLLSLQQDSAKGRAGICGIEPVTFRIADANLSTAFRWVEHTHTHTHSLQKRKPPSAHQSLKKKSMSSPWGSNQWPVCCKAVQTVVSQSLTTVIISCLYPYISWCEFLMRPFFSPSLFSFSSYSFMSTYHHNSAPLCLL